MNNIAKYQEWTSPEKQVLLEGWAKDGLTDEQISHNMGISASTLYEWKKKHPEFSETIKKGKEVVDYEVENALLQQAMNGNVTACIFWLKCRRPEKWNDQRKPDVKPDMEDDPITAALKRELENGTL